MDYDELIKSLGGNEKNKDIYMPNEIFDDIRNVTDASTHMSFTYSYYYLISWLYRYAVYGNKVVTVEDCKEILGLSRVNKKVNYIIKKNGVLDKIGYTTSSTNYPVAWKIEMIGKVVELEFEMITDCDKQTREWLQKDRGKNYKIKVPMKGLYRTIESKEDCYEDGTFFLLDNTHHIPFDVFAYSMCNEDVGTIGFYIWGYLRMKNQMYKNGYDVSLDILAKEIGLPRSTLVKYLVGLRKYKMIETIHNQEYFVLGLEDDKRKANTYIANEYELFSDQAITYNKIKRMSKGEYEKLNGKVELGDELDELFA